MNVIRYDIDKKKLFILNDKNKVDKYSIEYDYNLDNYHRIIVCKKYLWNFINVADGSRNNDFSGLSFALHIDSYFEFNVQAGLKDTSNFRYFTVIKHNTKPITYEFLDCDQTNDLITSMAMISKLAGTKFREEPEFAYHGNY